MNFLNQKPYEAINNHLGRTNASRNSKSHVTFSFKVTRESHAIGNSWNDFFDLKNLGNKKVHHSSTTTTSIRNHALKYDAFDVIDDVIGVT